MWWRISAGTTPLDSAAVGSAPGGSDTGCEAAARATDGRLVVGGVDGVDVDGAGEPVVSLAAAWRRDEWG